MTVAEAERRLIYRTLEFTQGNRTHAAQMLGISIRTLRNKLHEYGTSTPLASVAVVVSEEARLEVLHG